jgi:hypothetical protein
MYALFFLICLFVQDLMQGKYVELPGKIESHITIDQATHLMKLAYVSPMEANLRHSINAYLSDYCPSVVLELHCSCDQAGAERVQGFKIRLPQKDEPFLLNQKQRK